jgi:Domain of unknown function (DUF4349)
LSAKPRVGEADSPASNNRSNMKRPQLIAAVSVLIIGGALVGLSAVSGHKVKTTFNSITNTLPGGGGDYVEPTAEAVAQANSPVDTVVDTQNVAASALTTTGGLSDSSANASLRNRKIIRAADVSMRSPNVAETSRRVGELIERDGGYLSAQDGNYSTEAQVTVEYRIPSENFDHVLTGLAGVATIESTHITSSEVTAQYVDLESRIKTMRLSADRLRELLASAAKSDIVNLENELTQRDADIAALQGQFDVLADQVSLSRISLTIMTKVPAPKVVRVAKALPPKTGHQTFGSAFASSIQALRIAGRFMAFAIGGVLPFVPFLLSGWGVAAFARRRLRVRRARYPQVRGAQ